MKPQRRIAPKRSPPASATVPRRKGKHVTYLYALVRSSDRPKLDEMPRGLERTGPARAVQVSDDLWLIAADAPLPAYSSERIDAGLKDLEWVSRCALAHENVLEQITRHFPTLPMKLFTLFSTDARAVEHIARKRRAVARLLDHVTDCREWGVRIMLHEAKAKHAAVEDVKRKAGTVESGAGFLMLKKSQQDAARTMQVEARQQAEDAFDRLARHARDAKRVGASQAPPGVRVLLESAFLVTTAAEPKFKREVAKLADALEPEGYAVLFTGPWPAYHFASEAP